METNMVRQPILGSDKELLGYELCYQDYGAGLYNQADTRAANVIEDFLVQLNSDRILDGATAFLTFTPNLLMKNIPKMFQPQKLVIQIDDNATIHPLAQKIVYRYKNQGYRIAVNGFEFSSRYFALLDVIDIIKIDVSKGQNSMESIVKIGQSFHKDIIAYNVNSQEAYDRAQALGCRYFQGSAVAQALSSKVAHMDHLQSNFFQLVISITKDEPDVDEIAEIISRDVTLAFSLIRLVNSAYFALRNRAHSVKQALVVLGLGQLKQWVYLLSFKNNEGGALVSELIKTSFLRASFCQELSLCAKNFTLSKSEAYLLGMFSTLGLLMEVPLEAALAELPIADEIKTGLITGEGLAGALYRLVVSYENADWAAMNACAEELGISANLISQKYFECCEAVNTIWRTLTMPYGEDGEENAADDAAGAALDGAALDGAVVKAIKEQAKEDAPGPREKRPIAKAAKTPIAKAAVTETPSPEEAPKEEGSNAEDDDWNFHVEW